MRELLIALLLLGGAACSSLSSRQTDALVKYHEVPEKAKVPDVPFIEQEENYCGPASLAMVLEYRGKVLSQEELASISYTKEKEGTFQQDLITAARRQGMMAVKISGLENLLREIVEGHPVIVFQNLGFSFLPGWHYAVALGYDLNGPDILLHTGDQKARAKDLRYFERTWTLAGQWGLVVLPPGELAASAGETSHLEGATGLERLGKINEARSAYQAILKRWPRSLVALIGLGNVSFAQRNYREAVRYLELAEKKHPGNAVVRNNLHVARQALKQ